MNGTKTEKIYSKEGDLLAIILRSGDYPEGLNFYNKEEDFIQLGTWKYQKGQKIKGHNHLIFERAAQRTQEAVYLKSGKLPVDLVFSETYDARWYAWINGQRFASVNYQGLNSFAIPAVNNEKVIIEYSGQIFATAGLGIALFTLIISLYLLLLLSAENPHQSACLSYFLCLYEFLNHNRFPRLQVQHLLYMLLLFQQ